MVDVPDWLTEARRICVLTGAGISTDTGIPDYRGPNGGWTRDLADLVVREPIGTALPGLVARD